MNALSLTIENDNGARRVRFGTRIEFLQVDEAQNRARVYVLEAGYQGQLPLFSRSNEPVLIRAWGRLGRRLKSRVELFGSWEALERAWAIQERRRRRRGYVVTKILEPPGT